MPYFLLSIQTLTALGAVLCLYLMFRNRSVYLYRTSLLNEVSRQAKADITANRDYTWRYDALNAVSYDQMVYKFWKKLDSFYPDKAFIRTSGSKHENV